MEHELDRGKPDGVDVLVCLFAVFFVVVFSIQWSVKQFIFLGSLDDFSVTSTKSTCLCHEYIYIVKLSVP